MTPSGQSSSLKTIVLLGGGHAHVQVLRAFAEQPEPGTRLVVVAKELQAPYSGMLPGMVAGHYRHEECHIDLRRLAGWAKATLTHDAAVGIDRGRRCVTLASGAQLDYDLLSIDVGITPRLDAIAGALSHAIAVKPVSSFARRWQALEEEALAKDGPRRFAVIGAGAAGFELILAIRQRLLSEAPARGLAMDRFRFLLVGDGAVLPSHNAHARTLARRALAAAGVRLVENERVVEIAPTALRFADGVLDPCDAALLTTDAAAPDWFAHTDLPRDGLGFLAVRPTLQLVDDDDIFAVGDCAAVLEHPRPKAGVFAVRQGPPLTRNLRRRARGEAAIAFVPQRRFLTLLSLGDRRAIAARGPFAIQGKWVWRWKDRIDRAFMARFIV